VIVTMNSTSKDANAVKAERVFQAALKHYQANNVKQALLEVKNALSLSPKHANALNLYAGLEIAEKNYANATKILTRSIEVSPGNYLLHYNLGVIQRLQGDNIGALSNFEQSINLKRDFPQSWLNRGVTLAALERVDEAIAVYQKALELKSDYAEVLCNLGNAYIKKDLFEKAGESYALAVKIKPDYAQAYFNFGVLAQKMKDHQKAIKHFLRSIEIQPNYAEAHGNLGISYKKIGDLDSSIASYKQALLINPNFFQAYSNLGTALKEARQTKEALTSYNKAIELNPSYAEAIANKGHLLHELKQYKEAIECFEAAINLAPNLYKAHLNYGNLLKEVRQYDKAVSIYDKAIEISQNKAESYTNKGHLFLETKRPERAVADYKKALNLNPNLDYLLGTKLHAEMQICDWSSFDQDLKRLKLEVECENKVTPCLPFLAMVDDLSLQQKVAQIWINDKHPENKKLGPVQKWAPHSKIRVGYFSADFHNHATTYLMAELFEMHNYSEFEIYAFSYGPDSSDAMRTRIKSAVTKFIDVRLMSDEDIATLARSLEIDIALDLKGFTLDYRMGIFAYRAAPIQVSYIGYPGTLGATYIDYVLADSVVAPESVENFFTEKIIRMPGSYQVNDRQRQVSSRKFTKLEVGLPESGLVFACFNNNYKITPEYFATWMRIIKRVEGSVLWLFEDNPHAARNLQMQAAKAGIDPSRLVFAKRMQASEHLARQTLADLFLDTGPYNAHTTASDALWVGLPVLTCIGQCFAARVAASLLSAHGVPELITQNLTEYEQRAVDLACVPLKLQAIREKIVSNQANSQLFDSRQFTHHLEQHFKNLVNRQNLEGGAVSEI
jgi:predicted O-linked N-acetylglucosamine transferase (SPINDLY family)